MTDVEEPVALQLLQARVTALEKQADEQRRMIENLEACLVAHGLMTLAEGEP